MIAAEDTILVLLAAGKSARFGGGESKLDQPLGDHALGLHAVLALAAIPFKARVAVVSRCRIDYAGHGFATVENDDPVGDMASSLRLGVAWAQEHAPAAVVVALADMPRVTAAHVGRLLAAAEGDNAVVASSADGPPRPPALFGRGRFSELLAITGDHGARDLIRAGRHLVTTSPELADVDTRDDLAAIQRR